MRGHFTKLSLKNWRNFKAAEVSLQKRVFVVGANASGKSNLLDVFRFLRDLASEGGGLTNALEGSHRGGLRAVRSLHARAVSEVEVTVDAEIEGEPWRYRLVLQAGGTSQRPGPARVVSEQVWHKKDPLLNRPSERDQQDDELLLETAIEQSVANAKFRPLRDFLRSTEYIHVVPHLLRSPGRDDAQRFGAGLGTGLIAAMGEVPKKTRDARLRRIQTALKGVLPQFETLEWIQDARGTPHLRAKYKHWRPQGAWQQESSFSDGTLRLIGLLWYLDAGQGPLLLEEPELSLHPAAVRLLPTILARLAQRTGRQVIMTTHSPDLMADTGIEPAELILLQASGSDTSVTNGSSSQDLRVAAKAGLPLDTYVEALTRPPEIGQLSFFGSRS